MYLPKPTQRECVPIIVVMHGCRSLDKLRISSKNSPLLLASAFFLPITPDRNPEINPMLAVDFVPVVDPMP